MRNRSVEMMERDKRDKRVDGMEFNQAVSVDPTNAVILEHWHRESTSICCICRIVRQRYLQIPSASLGTTAASVRR